MRSGIGLEILTTPSKAGSGLKPEPLMYTIRRTKVKGLISKLIIVSLLLCLWAVHYTTAGTVSYTYDDAGRLTRVSSGDGRLIKYTYDNAGNLLQKETVVCVAEAIETSSNKLTLKGKKKQDVTVTMTGADDCPSEGITVEATVNAAGKKRVSVSPSSKETDDKGQAMFTINAKNKSGNAKITFKAGGLSKSISVKVGK